MTRKWMPVEALTATLWGSVGLASGYLGWRLFILRKHRGALALNETLPIHSKWWRDHAKVKGELLYIALGDSAAQGIGASEPRRSYVGLLADDIRDLTGQTVRVVNLSVSGATVALAVDDQLPRLARRRRPDIMTVAIGANDIADFDPVGFEKGLRTIFAALPSHAIVADLPYFYFPKNERRVAIANQIVRRLAREHRLRVAPLYEATRKQGLIGIARGFARDLFHPNDHGYRVWASAFRPLVAASLAERLSQRADGRPGRHVDHRVDAS